MAFPVSGLWLNNLKGFPLGLIGSYRPQFDRDVCAYNPSYQVTDTDLDLPTDVVPQIGMAWLNNLDAVNSITVKTDGTVLATLQPLKSSFFWPWQLTGGQGLTVSGKGSPLLEYHLWAPLQPLPAKKTKGGGGGGAGGGPAPAQILGQIFLGQ